MKGLVIHILFLLIAVGGFPQNSETDSIARLRALLKTNLSDSLKFVTHIKIAERFYLKKEYDSVVQAVDEGLRLKNFSNPNFVVRAHSFAGTSYDYLGKYDMAILSYLNALKICDEYDENPVRIYNNLGMVYINLEQWIRAEDYLNKALKLCEELNLKRGMSYIYGNLGIIFRNQKKYDQSLRAYRKSVKLNFELNDQEALARNHNNLGSLYRHTGDLDSAVYYCEKGLQVSIEIDYKQSMASNYISLGGIYTDLKNHNQAVDHFEKGIDIANELKDVRLMRDGYLGLAILDEKRGKFQEAVKNRKLFEQWKDSLTNESHLTKIGKLEIQYETEKKDKEIVEQKLQLEQQENELQKKQTQYSIMTGVAIILLISSLMGWFLYQQRQKRKNQEILTLKREQQVKTLESLMQGEEKERLRIAKELHDGVNGDLSAIKYKLTAMVEHNTEVVREVVGMLDKSSEQVRAISHNLVPPALEKFELVEALADYCTSMNDIHEPEISFQHLGDSIRLTKNNEVNIYRIIQELVGNSIKHAGADEVTVQISHRDGTILITIEDNGIGFEKDTVEGNGIGLKNVQSRIDYLNANMDFVSSPNGTSYTIEIDTSKLNDN